MTTRPTDKKNRGISHRNTALELTISPRAYNMTPFTVAPRPGNIIPAIEACNKYLRCVPPHTRTVALDIRLYDGQQQIFRTHAFGDLKMIKKRLQNTVDEILKFKI